MAEVVHFVVLALLTIISVGNCVEREHICTLKPSWKLSSKCVANPTSEYRTTEEVVCILSNAGILSEKGSIDADRLKELMQPHVIEGKQEQADAYMEIFRACAEKVGAGKTKEEAVKALLKCEDDSGGQKYYLQALCDDAPL